jgi:hypothetical protein
LVFKDLTNGVIIKECFCLVIDFAVPEHAVQLLLLATVHATTYYQSLSAVAKHLGFVFEK